MSTTRRFALAFGLTAGLACAIPAALLAQNQDTITGSYQVAGMNPSGSKYKGEAQILQDGGTVSINWTVGQDSYSGAGIRDGRLVVIDWGDEAPIVYVVMPSGELHGTWGNASALERLIPN